MFTRQHYKAIAEIIKNNRPDISPHAPEADLQESAIAETQLYIARNLSEQTDWVFVFCPNPQCRDIISERTLKQKINEGMVISCPNCQQLFKVPKRKERKP